MGIQSLHIWVFQGPYLPFRKICLVYLIVFVVSNALAIAARSYVYVVDEILTLNVPNVYPLFPCCNHLRRGSKSMIDRYRLRVSPCIVPL